MRIEALRLAPALLVTGALALAGCGHDTISVGEAKAKLAADCEQGHFGDRAQCACLADELQARGRSGPQIDALRLAINFGTKRAEVTQASDACAARIARGGR